MMEPIVGHDQGDNAMLFVAFLLTLTRGSENKALKATSASILCPALSDFLSQRHPPCPGGFLKVAIFSQQKKQITFRITLTEGTLWKPIPPVLETLFALPNIPLDEEMYTIASVDLTDSTWSGISTWSDLVESTTGSLVRFSFLSPLVMEQAVASGKPATLLFPEPVLLFSYLVQAWNTLGGLEFAFSSEQMVQASRCMVSNYRLSTTSCWVAGCYQVGYLGWIEYECRCRQAHVLAPLNVLARLAFFTGLGELTEYGMGATAVTILY